MKLKYGINEADEIIPLDDNATPLYQIIFNSVKEAQFYKKYILPTEYGKMKLKKYNYNGFKLLFVNMMKLKKTESQLIELNEKLKEYNYLNSKEFYDRFVLINEMEELRIQKIVTLHKYRIKVVDYLNNTYNLNLSYYDKDVYNFLVNQSNYHNIKKYENELEDLQNEFMGKIHLIEKKESDNSGKYIKILESYKHDSLKVNANKNTLFKIFKNYLENQRWYKISNYVCQYFVDNDNYIEPLEENFHKIRYDNDNNIYNILAVYNQEIEVITHIITVDNEYLLIGHKGSTFPENSNFYLIKNFEGDIVEI